MRSSDSPHAASPTALVASTTASKGEARERVGTPTKPVPDALLILVRELARQAAVNAWRTADGASSQSGKETCS